MRNDLECGIYILNTYLLFVRWPIYIQKSMEVYSFARAAVLKYRELGGFTNNFIDPQFWSCAWLLAVWLLGLWTLTPDLCLKCGIS